MRAARIGPVLLALGLLVGAAAGVGLLVGFEPAELPRALLNIAAYKLTFLAAAGLLAAGALVLRYDRRGQHAEAPAADPDPETAALPEGLPPELAPDQRPRREPAREGRER